MSWSGLSKEAERMISAWWLIPALIAGAAAGVVLTAVMAAKNGRDPE